MLTVAGVSLVAVIVLFLGMQILMVRRMRRQKGRPAPELEGAEGEAIRSGGSSLFYFYSPRCGACRAMTPVVQEMAKKRGDAVFPVDISRDLSMARQFGVMATPTTILVRDGSVADVLIGPQPESALRAMV